MRQQRVYRYTSHQCIISAAALDGAVWLCTPQFQCAPIVHCMVLGLYNAEFRDIRMSLVAGANVEYMV